MLRNNSFVWFLLGVVTVVAISCSSLQKFEPSTATFSKSTEWVPVWEVDDRDQEIREALKAHGKLVVIERKEENPVVQWVFGGGLVIGGVLILLGIAFIWLTKGVKLVQGLMISGAGLSIFAAFYLIEAYLIQICLAGGVALLGTLLYIFLFKKDLMEKLIQSFEDQKDKPFSDAEETVKATQGNKQPVISKIRKKVLK